MSDNINLPKPFQRLYDGPIDKDSQFSSMTELNAYLTNPRRYAGQKVVVIENGKISNYQLNGLANAWTPFDKETVEESKALVDASGLAGEDIGANRVIICDTDGKRYTADSSSASHASKVIGLSKVAVLEGASVEMIIAGTVTDPTFSFIPGKSIFFTSQGVLTQTPPSAGFIQIVAKAISATSIIVGLRPPTIIA